MDFASFRRLRRPRIPRRISMFRRYMAAYPEAHSPWPIRSRCWNHLHLTCLPASAWKLTSTIINLRETDRNSCIGNEIVLFAPSRCLSCNLSTHASAHVLMMLMEPLLSEQRWLDQSISCLGVSMFRFDAAQICPRKKSSSSTLVICASTMARLMLHVALRSKPPQPPKEFIYEIAC